MHFWIFYAGIASIFFYHPIYYFFMHFANFTLLCSEPEFVFRFLCAYLPIYLSSDSPT
jgi:hypothetical protein